MIKRHLLFVAALAFATAALAAQPAPATHDYLAAGAVDYRIVITPPPAEDSIAGQADHEIARALDTHRTPEQATLAKHYEKFSPFIVLADVLGDWCTPGNLPRTKAVFAQCFLESRAVVDAAKEAYDRKRPYVYNPALHPAVDKPNNASYPSGHAYSAALTVAFLSAALPEHAAEWEQRGDLVRWSRLVGGAHYPTDIMAGKILGEAVAREMLKSPQLQAALQEVRAEILAHLQKKAA